MTGVRTGVSPAALLWQGTENMPMQPEFQGHGNCWAKH